MENFTGFTSNSWLIFNSIQDGRLNQPVKGQKLLLFGQFQRYSSSSQDGHILKLAWKAAFFKEC